MGSCSIVLITEVTVARDSVTERIYCTDRFMEVMSGKSLLLYLIIRVTGITVKQWFKKIPVSVAF